jgi:vitamin B12 transporter
VSRKSVSPFLAGSGNRPHSIAVLAVATGMMLVFPRYAPAQSAEIDEIFVLERRIEETLPLDLSRYGSRLEIITAADIERQGFTDIGQSLQRLVPGLFVAPKNGPFDYFSGSLQGSRSQDILWLIDGVRIANRLYNTTMPLDTVPANMVERIEVLKGGQGIFYGTQSVSGVVNIVTRGFSKETDGQVSAGVHSNDGYNVGGFLRGSTSDHEFVLYASKDDADGFQPFRDEHYQPSSNDRNRSYDVTNVGVKYGHDLSEQSRISLHYQRTENEVDFARPAQTITAFNEREEDIVTLKWDYLWQGDDGLYVKAYYHDWDSWFTRLDNDLANPGQVITIDDRSFWGYEDYGLNAMSRFTIADSMQLVAGFDHQSYSGRDDVLLIADRTESVDAVFLQVRTLDGQFPGTRLAAGVRYNKPDKASGMLLWNVSGRHDFGNDVYIRGNVGTAFRLPDAWQLFGNDPCCTQGNPELDGEESLNVNLAVGAELAAIGDGLSWELIAFHRTVDNLIGSSGGIRVNTQNKVTIAGGEALLKYSSGNDWSTTLSLTVTDAEATGSGQQIPDIPELTGKLLIAYSPANASFGINGSILYVGDVYSDVGGFFPDGHFEEHGSYAVVDVSGYYEFGKNDQQRLVARVENLFDEDYATSVRTATSDVGAPYLYDNLGVPQTAHLIYSYSF